MSDSSRHLRWPEDRCYWAILDAPLPRSGQLPPGHVALAEEQLPFPAELVFFIGVPVDARRSLACGIPREALEGIDELARSLSPRTIPEALGVVADPLSLNFLVGAHEPRHARRARRRIHTFAAACVLVSACLAAIGLVRRERHWVQAALDADASVAERWASIEIPGEPGAIDAELARLETVASEAGSMSPGPDAGIALESALRAWPTHTNATPLSISVQPGATTISLTLTGDPAQFLEEFAVPEGWSLDEPRLNVSDRLSRLSLTLRAKKGTP